MPTETVDEHSAEAKDCLRLLMGVTTSGITSFVIVALNLGFTERFAIAWLRSWVIAYVIVIPAILAIGPWVQKLVERLVPDPSDAPRQGEAISTPC